jgi:regulator of protease activity HflC (stomatin/prohibitin superfamily)
MSLFRDTEGSVSSTKVVVFCVGALILLFLVIAFLPFTIVSAGERGVVTRFGAVQRTLQPGFHFLTPFIENSTSIDVQTQKEQTDAEAASSDLQSVRTTVAVNYNVDPEKVADLYTRISTDYKGRIIDPGIQEVVKAVTANYTAEELITKRADVTSEVQSQLATRLVSSDIIVTGVSIVNFNFSDSFNQAIEAKVTAQQNALAAENKLAQVKFEAQQTVTSAQAQAEAIKIQAQAINSQGGADYVQLQAIKQWNGILPTSMIPSGAVPFINLNNK